MRALVLVPLLLGLSQPASAQQEAETPPRVAAEIDATKLGVSLSRIQRQLRIAESREKSTSDGLRLEFNIQVFGTAPKIEVLKGIDLVNGAVPGTAPSHKQYIEYMTPQMYRLPALPISAFAALAAQWMWQESKKSRCEQEIANYRELVMQGVNVAAPRCTQ
jgi:hypothetical protein